MDTKTQIEDIKTTALFVAAKGWEQPGRSSKQTIHIYMGYCTGKSCKMYEAGRGRGGTTKVQDIQDGHHVYLQQGDTLTDTHSGREGGRPPANQRGHTRNREQCELKWRITWARSES